MTKHFLLIEQIHQAGMQVLEQAGEIHWASAPDEETLVRELDGIDGLVLRTKGRMTRSLVERTPSLKVIGRHGVGVDNVDVQACTDLGIQVVNTPEAVIQGVAEHTLGLMLAVSKQIVAGHEALRQGDFGARYRLRGRELRGRTLGVIGFGNIGRQVGGLCHRALGMQILYHDVHRAPELEASLGARYAGIETVLAESDCVTVHVPLLPQTRGLIGAREFGLMKPRSIFVNASRGPVVDEKALYDALASGRLLGAAIDVFAQEPTPPDNPLLTLPNIVATPHMATATDEALRKMSLVAEDIVAVVDGRQPRYPVNHLSS